MILHKLSTLMNVRSGCLSDDPFNMFPVGLVILEKEINTSNITYQISFANEMAGDLLAIPKNNDIELFKKKIKCFKKLTNLNNFNYQLDEINLSDQIFSHQEFDVISEKFVSLNLMIYVKIRYMENIILISVGRVKFY